LAFAVRQLLSNTRHLHSTAEIKPCTQNSAWFCVMRIGGFMNVLVIDVGGTNVKVLATGETERRKFPSGPQLTPQRMVAEVKEITKDWKYEVVSLGIPSPVDDGHPQAEPRNLGPGWVYFAYDRVFGCPVKIINDAAMQALGSYKSGKMLFLGLGTGLGSCVVVNGRIGPLELATLPYKKGKYEDYVNRARLESKGRKKWSQDVAEVVAHLKTALRPDEIVLGGGNARKLTEIPEGCRVVTNANAFIGGFLMWQNRQEEEAANPLLKAS
jgi:predicted NBD/HSP70 family sugar kinase